MLNCDTRTNGPEPTGFGFRNLLMSATFEKTCFGTTKMPLRFTDTNSESRVFSLIRTV